MLSRLEYLINFKLHNTSLRVFESFIAKLIVLDTMFVIICNLFHHLTCDQGFKILNALYVSMDDATT